MNVAEEVTRMNGARIAPVVPGLNAQPLGPSIGTDHHRLTGRERPRRNGQLRQARPISGRGHAELIRTRKPRERTLDRAPDRAGTADFRSLSYAETLASL